MMDYLMRGKISLAEKHPELIAEWDESNGELTPWKVSFASEKRVIWKGKCGHRWEAPVCYRSRGKGCPVCHGLLVQPGVNDFESLYPEIAKEWSDKNLPCKPSEFTAGSAYNAWWKCRVCGHEWQTIIFKRSKGSGCIFCKNHIARKGVNDLATLYPDIAAEWNYGSNINFKPDKISISSIQIFYWKCRKGHVWRATIMERIKDDRCPFCVLYEKHQVKLKSVIFYARKAGLDIEYMSRAPEVILLELYIPAFRTAIILSDEMKKWKKLRKKEVSKNWLCIRKGIKLFRIIQPGYEGFDNCACIYLKEDSYDEFSLALKTIFRSIKAKTDLDIDVERDIREIEKIRLEGERDDEESNDKDNTTGTWNTTMAGNMLPGL